MKTEPLQCLSSAAHSSSLIHKPGRLVIDDKYVYVMGAKGVYRNLKTDSPVSVASYSRPKSNGLKTGAVFFKNGMLFCALEQSSSAEINLFNLAGRQYIFPYIPTKD